jgi:hypothetical protein
MLCLLGPRPLVKTHTQKKNIMDYLLRVAEEQYVRTRDPYLLDVYNLADFCYRKWGDTSDYDRLLRMIHREPLFGLAPPSGYLFASRGRVSERKRFA